MWKHNEKFCAFDYNESKRHFRTDLADCTNATITFAGIFNAHVCEIDIDQISSNDGGEWICYLSGNDTTNTGNAILTVSILKPKPVHRLIKSRSNMAVSITKPPETTENPQEITKIENQLVTSPTNSIETTTLEASQNRSGFYTEIFLKPTNSTLATATTSDPILLTNTSKKPIEALDEKCESKFDPIVLLLTLIALFLVVLMVGLAYVFIQKRKQRRYNVENRSYSYDPNLNKVF